MLFFLKGKGGKCGYLVRIQTGSIKVIHYDLPIEVLVIHLGKWEGGRSEVYTEIEMVKKDLLSALHGNNE